MSAQAAAQSDLPLGGQTKSTSGTEPAARDGKEEAKATEAKGGESILGGAAKADEKKAEGEQKADGKDAPAELEIKLPEGMEVDAKDLGEFKTFIKDKGLKLDSETASALVAWSAERQAAAIKADQEEAKQRGNAWLEEVKKDPEFGGAKFAETAQAAQRALNRFGDKELADFFVRVGLENHPGIVRMLARIGRATADDKSTVGTGGRAAGAESEVEKLKKAYPNSPDMFRS